MAARVPIEMPTAVTVAAFDEWVAAAEPGAELVYAQGPAIPRDAPAWGHARALHEDKVVTLFSKRDPATATRWLWIARRLRVEAGAEPAPAPPVAEIDEDNPTDRVLRALRRAANMEQVCPNNATIARLAGLTDAAAASYRIGLLIAAKRIKVESQGPNAPRIVTIVSSGRSTA